MPSQQHRCSIHAVSRGTRDTPKYAQCGGKQGLLRSLMDSRTQSPAVTESHQESLAADESPSANTSSCHDR
jgi:hypothetical protein